MIFGNGRKLTIQIDSLGDVELKYVSFGDMIKFDKIAQEQMADRDFVANVLLNQITTPDIDLIPIQGLPDEQLEKMGRAFMVFENDTFEHFQESGDFYYDFKQALVVKQEKENEELRKQVEPVIRSVQQQFAAFGRNYTSAIAQAAYDASYIRDALSSVAEVATKINNDQLRVISSLKPTIDYINSAASMVTEALLPQIEFWQKWVEQNSGLFDSFTRYWAEFQQKYNIAESEATQTLRRYKWFITPSLPLGFVFEVVEVGKRPGRQDRAINSLFINYFEANNWHNLEVMVKRWKSSSLLKSRYKILSDCVKTIKLTRKKQVNIATVILPTLITQIDGALSDYLYQNGIAWDSDYDDWIDRKTGKIKKVGRKTQLRRTKPKILTTQLDDLANDVFLNILFQKSQKGKPLETPFNFNRHKIIHGETVRYGRKDYMIRAFMVLDLLAHF